LGAFSGTPNYVITSAEGYAMCLKSNYGFDNAKDGGIWLEKCHMGMTTVNAPIHLDDKCEAIITCGQVLMRGYDKEFFEGLKEKSRQLYLDYDELRTRAETIKVLSEEEILIRGQFLMLLAGYISITEAELRTRSKYLEEYKTNMELEAKLKNSEFKFLQSQISPHFLFNTLNLLARTAKREGAVKTSDLVYDLSDLLHWAFKSKNSICTFSEEINCVNSYLNIQRARFGNQLNADVFLDNKLNDYMIPVLTIQPLVENVIIHGMKNIKKKVDLRISVKEEAGWILIDISDTGIGMDEETLRNIRNHTDIGNNIGNGIKNVEDRLKLYFGASSHFQIVSAPGAGTRISIRWPMQLK
jgi:two-component system LytT family sensor kinase